jgi:hypothetical protein
MESMNTEILEIADAIADLYVDAGKVDARPARGWKSAGLRIRKASLLLEKRLKALRKASLEIERA